MLRRWIVSLVIGFIVRQIGQWRDGIDWAKVREDAEARIRALIPGEWFDDTAVSIVMTLIDAAEAVLSASKELEVIIALAADGKYQEAWDKLRQLILDNWKPEGEHELMVYECVKDCEKIA